MASSDTTVDLAATHERVAELRSDIARRGIQNLIGGMHVPAASGQTFTTFSPMDNSPIAEVAAGDRADIDLAAQAARDAFPAWRDLDPRERQRLLLKVADLIERDAEDIALMEVLDTGQAIRFMKEAANRGAENFRFFADRVAGARDGLALPSAQHLNYTIRQPIGPVAAITPWNTPFMLSTWKIAPALAAGCTVVHKPAEWSPLTALRLSELIHEAGIPDGVVNLVNGLGETAGKAATEHPDIRAVAFIGESITGSAIMSQGAATLKRVHFELGGKNPVFVFADADLERALDAVIFMIYSLNGERCTSSSRVLIERSIYDEFTARLAERVPRIRVGDPFDPATEVGPLIHPEHLSKVESYVQQGQDDGATLAAGGCRVPGLEHGNYIAPTLFTNVNGTMKIAQDEVFGPYLVAIPFDDEEDAIRIANDVRYGLAAYLWTGDVGRAHRVSQAVDAGMIWVNSHNVRHLPTPFGGMKSSGIGRDGGDYSFDFYMETKNIAIATGNHRIPKLGA